ncbi:MAG: hypothetical protein ACSLFH_01700 [Desulfuromonadales bacterium]
MKRFLWLMMLWLIVSAGGVSAGAVSVPLRANHVYVLSWTPASSDADGIAVVDQENITYELQESTDLTFTTVRVVPLQDPHASDAIIAGKRPGTYYYRVRAVHPSYQPGPWIYSINGHRVL